MKIFIFDERGTVSSVVKNSFAVRRDIEIYSLAGSLYRQQRTIDEFFYNAVRKPLWYNVREEEDVGRFSLVELLDAAGDSCLFLIDVNVRVTSRSFRQDQDGVDILKHIRLTEELAEGRNCHVILYSFEYPLELIRRKPGNVMLLSEGASFLRFPRGLDIVSESNTLESLAKKKARIRSGEFRRYVYCDYTPTEPAHTFSNWWGLRQIFLARRALYPGKTVTPSDVVEKNLRWLENKKAAYLFGHCSAEAEPSTTAGISKDFVAGLKIAYVDDERAWGDTLPEWLTEDLGGKLRIKYYPPPERKSLENDETLKTWAKLHLIGLRRDDEPAVVLLDLRLYGNREIDIPIASTSGASIAKVLRDINPGLPIILMTASNKAYTLEAAMKIGIDAYWMKEGIGEHAPQRGMSQNYEQLLRFVSTAMGADYQFLRRFSQAVSDITAFDGKHWWENPPWSHDKAASVNRSLVTATLDGIVVLLREYLRLFRMNYGFIGSNANDLIEQSWINSLIVEVMKTVELIHKVDALTAIKLHSLLDSRGDHWGVILNGHRNHAAHASNEIKKVRFSHAQSVISGVIAWLRVPIYDRKGAFHSDVAYVAVNGSNAFHPR